MPHSTVLIATVAAGLGAAFVFGLLAARLRLPPIVGYLVAGVIVGTLAPGTVDEGLATQLAELGVILLMFGVGLHFSLGDLASVRGVVVPGALAQTIVTTTLAVSLARWWGWSWGGAVVLGLSLGVASTVVLLKGLERRDRLDSPEGRIAVGWLVVEDLTMVLALVLLPALAPVLRGGEAARDAGPVALPLTIAVAKVAVFMALMYFVGRRFVPWLLERVVRLGSRELFTLAVLVIALGVGTIAADLFGVSFALGAFFAGVVVSESELSQRAAADALPMQDAFAVLFFVSVGMLFDPRVLVEQPGRVAALVALVVLWKSALAFGLVRLLGQPPRIALAVGAALGQIGEFSFIVVGVGVSLALVPPETAALVVAAAIVAIALNGPVFALATRLSQRLADRAAADAIAHASRLPAAHHDAGAEDAFEFPELSGHVVVVGYGRVGSTVTDALTRAGADHVVVEEQDRIVGGLRKRGERSIHGDATRADVLERAGVSRARLLVVTAPEPFRARRIVALAREANPRISIAVRTDSAAEQSYFEEYLGAPGAGGRSVYAEREAALSLAHYALVAIGRSDDEADWVVASLRGQRTAPTETFASLPTQEYQALLRATRDATRDAGGQPKAPGSAGVQ